MTSKQRQIVQNQFINNQIKLICATNAFGMGVDKPDIRFVVHYQLPACLENYYQEVGRAGRDRQNSDCYLLFHQPDIKIQLGLINNQNNQSIQQLKINKFKKMIEFALEPGCLGQKISVYFEQTPKSACHSCSFCLSDKLGLDLSEKKLLARLTKQPIIPWQTKYLAAILQPLEKEQWLKLPGIGTGLSKKLDFYT